jgi:hypothetical protein
MLMSANWLMDDCLLMPIVSFVSEVARSQKVRGSGFLGPEERVVNREHD